MKLYPGSVEESSTIYTDPAPAYLHRHFLHAFERIYVHGDWGYYLSQRFHLPNCSCWHIHVKCNESTRFFASSAAAFYGICHMLSGTVKWISMEASGQALIAGHSASIYIPGGLKQPVQFTAGVHELWLVCWQPGFLQDRKSLSTLLEHAQQAPATMQVRKMPYSYHWEHLLPTLYNRMDPGLLLEARMLEALQVYQQLKENPVQTLLDKVAQVKQLLDGQLNQHSTIAQLARRSGLSEATLKRCFREQYGQSIYQYLVEQRMQYALQELQQTNRYIREISLECGYHSASHFTYRFRKRFGMLPQDVRHKRNAD